MVFDIITIFPELFPPYLNESLLKRAQAKKLMEFRIHNLRDYTSDRHQTVDDRPYGGGPGMILRADIVIRCLQELGVRKLAGRVRQNALQATCLPARQASYPAAAGPRLGGGKPTPRVRTIALDPAGKQLNQATARRLAKYDQLILLCGRYEGFDERVYKFVDEKISIGPYVLAGGELPALVLIDTVSRMIPGVVGDPKSIVEETHSSDGYVEYPQYTRPETLVISEQRAVNREYKVPKVLLSGNHKKIMEWRRKHSKRVSKSS